MSRHTHTHTLSVLFLAIAFPLLLGCEPKEQPAAEKMVVTNDLAGTDLAGDDLASTESGGDGIANEGLAGNTEPKAADQPTEKTKPSPLKASPMPKEPSTVAANADDARTIAEEAFVYGLPMVMNYAVLNEYFINPDSGQFKCSFNEMFNTARVYTPADTAVVTPNSDTPYSFFCADLRAESVVVTVPEIEKERYYAIQLVDLYTFNYGYIGSRTTGNGAGDFMIAGPSWQGKVPDGIKEVFHCETDFTIGIFRTQLFNPADMEEVKKVQSGYKIQTLSSYTGEKAPPTPPKIDWPKIDKRMAATDPFSYLSFLLQFCPATGPAEEEESLRGKFTKIGIEAGEPYPFLKLTAEQKTAIAEGIKAGQEKVKQRVKTIGKEVNGWSIGSAFGNRDFFQGDWALRAAAAEAGIYGNDAAEATYPLTRNDGSGEPLDGSEHNYTLTFAKDQFPPVNAFWSVTMYDGESQLLVKNPLDRYLINSPMLPELKKNEDGSLTLYIQKESPGKERESNWLPAPDGPIYLVMRLYWPRKEAPSVLPPGEGSWQPPAVKQAD